MALEEVHLELGAEWRHADEEVRRWLERAVGVWVEEALAVLAGNAAGDPGADDGGEPVCTWMRRARSLPQVLRSGFVTQRVLIGAFRRELAGQAVDAVAAIALLEQAELRLGGYFDDRCLRIVAQCARATRPAGDAAARRLELVGRLLAGGMADSASLGYELLLHHVGVVAWGAAPADAVLSLADATGRRGFVVPLGADRAWGWLGGVTGLTPEEERTIERFAPGDGSAVALGDCLPGSSGFRTSHRQACEAERIARRRLLPVCRYHEVALEALALRDEDAARTFVDRELGVLSADTGGASGAAGLSRLDRETLAAYFGAGLRYSGAAALLGVTDETVSNRLRRIEDRLGVSVVQRHAELQAALRLYEILHGAR